MRVTTALSGPPQRLVLLPGLDGTGKLFRPLLAALPPQIRPIVVAFPDHRPLGYPELLPIVRAALPTGTPFVLLGESFSGPLALMAAAQHPPGLVAVVLSASFVRNPHPYVPGWCGALIRPSMLRLYPVFAALKALLGSYAAPALRALAVEAMMQPDPAVLAHRLRAVLRVDTTAALAGCRVPLLYLRGSRDFVVPWWNARAIRRTLPAATIVSLPSPHMVLQTQPVLAMAALQSFLNSCGVR